VAHGAPQRLDVVRDRPDHQGGARSEEHMKIVEVDAGLWCVATSLDLPRASTSRAT